MSDEPQPDLPADEPKAKTAKRKTAARKRAPRKTAEAKPEEAPAAVEKTPEPAPAPAPEAPAASEGEGGRMNVTQVSANRFSSKPARREDEGRREERREREPRREAEGGSEGDEPRALIQEPPAPETVGGGQGGKRRRRRRRGRGGEGQEPREGNGQPLSSEIDPEEVEKKAWKIFLAEVSEEGLALISDQDAKEISRRAFRLAELFLEEAARH